MFIAGICTLIQLYPIWKIGSRLPVVMGTSSGFIGTAKAIGSSYGYGAIIGATLVGAIIEMGLGFFIKPLRKLFPPLVTSLVIISIGLSLLPVGINYFAGGVTLSGCTLLQFHFTLNTDGHLQLNKAIENGIEQVLLFLGGAYLNEDYSIEKQQEWDRFKTEIEEKHKNTPKYKTDIFKLRQSKENDSYFDDSINFSAFSFSKNRTFSYEKEFRIVIAFTDERVATLKSEGVIKEYTNQDVRKSFIDLSFDLNGITGFNSAPLMEEICIAEGIAVKNNIPELENIEITPSASSVRF